MIPDPPAVLVLGDLFLAGRRSGVPLAARLSMTGRWVGLDGSGPGGLAGITRRCAIAAASFPWTTAIVCAGIEDAPDDPSPRAWLDAGEATLRTLLAVGEDRRVVLVIPPPIGDGIGDAGRWSTGTARRWSSRIPPHLAERAAKLGPRVSVVGVAGIARADDAWPSPAGEEWLAEFLLPAPVPA